MPVNFFSEDVAVALPKRKLKKWICQSIMNEGKEPGTLNIIFCSDSYLHEINLQYLNHDSYTDIVTFPYDDEGLITGDIFISSERVKENASNMGQKLLVEHLRVLIHGILHILGYNDKTPEEQDIMRKREDHYIDRYLQLFHVEL